MKAKDNKISFALSSSLSDENKQVKYDILTASYNVNKASLVEKPKMTLSLKRHLWSSSSLRAAAITNSAVLQSSISAETLSTDLETAVSTESLFFFKSKLKESLKLKTPLLQNSIDLQVSVSTPTIQWQKNFAASKTLAKQNSDSENLVRKKLNCDSSALHKTVTFSVSDPNYSKSNKTVIINDNTLNTQTSIGTNLLRHVNLQLTSPLVECNFVYFCKSQKNFYFKF